MPLRIAIFALSAAAALIAFPAGAADPFFKGKRLTLLIGSAAGGPTDIEGRLFAKYLVRHIEGQPSVIVQNKAGAGGVVGPTFLGEVGPRDGTMLGYFSGTAWNYVNEPERWRVDLKSFEFIAYQSGTTIVFVRTDVPPGLRAPADIVKAQGLVAGGLAVDNPKDIRMRLGLDMLGAPYRYVTGYGSGSPARLALQRGEINLFSESPPSYRAVIAPSLVKTGEVIPLWYDASGESEPTPRSVEGLTIPSFPQLYRTLTGKAPSGPRWGAFRTIHEVNSSLQRLVALPPGSPQAAIDALRAAVARLNQDREFAAESVRTIEFAPDYVTGPDLSACARDARRLARGARVRGGVHQERAEEVGSHQNLRHRRSVHRAARPLW
jgi:tripartite-type tricarboxylate transporter receptor subunit TctC